MTHHRYPFSRIAQQESKSGSMQKPYTMLLSSLPKVWRVSQAARALAYGTNGPQPLLVRVAWDNSLWLFQQILFKMFCNIFFIFQGNQQKHWRTINPKWQHFFSFPVGATQLRKKSLSTHGRVCWQNSVDILGFFWEQTCFQCYVGFGTMSRLYITKSET